MQVNNEVLTTQSKIEHLHHLIDAYKDLNPNCGLNHPVIKLNNLFVSELKRKEANNG